MRSCFIEFDSFTAACEAMIQLRAKADAGEILDFEINSIARDGKTSVYFSLILTDLDGRGPKGGYVGEDEFIAAAEALGGEYTGS
jgi:hypothetical protein